MHTSQTPNFLWALRILWTGLAFVAGPSIAEASADRSRSVQIVIAVAAWSGWGVVLTATLLPRTTTLTVFRMIAPASVPLTCWAATGGSSLPLALLAVAWSSTCLVVGSTPAVTDAFVDGSSYGEERRLALRIPASLSFVAVPVTWSVTATLVGLGLVGLAAEQWLLGGISSVLAAGAVAVSSIRIHQLARRWLVFVPAGVVVHDPLSIADPALVPRHLIRSIGPAQIDTDAFDLTGGTYGLVLEISVADPLDISRRKGRSDVENRAVTSILVAPLRPGEAMSLAADRRLPIG